MLPIVYMESVGGIEGGGEERYTKLSDMAWGVEYESAIAKLAICTWK